ncbi:hypothetical protein LJD35_18390, partial [Bifidobacterium sp. MSK23_139]|nr:hypothetical protein [Bifidobacterium sp. MSK23_139]
MLKDNVKACRLLEDGTYKRVAPKLADSQNIASKNYQDTPLFTNGKMVNGVPSEPTATPINDSLS